MKFSIAKEVISEKIGSQEVAAIKLSENGYPISKVHLNRKLNGKTPMTSDDMIAIANLVDSDVYSLFFLEMDAKKVSINKGGE